MTVALILALAAVAVLAVIVILQALRIRRLARGKRLWIDVGLDLADDHTAIQEELAIATDEIHRLERELRSARGMAS